MFTVTATITLNYDPADGLVTTAQEAHDDMLVYLSECPSLNNYDITIQES